MHTLNKARFIELLLILMVVSLSQSCKKAPAR